MPVQPVQERAGRRGVCPGSRQSVSSCCRSAWDLPCSAVRTVPGLWHAFLPAPCHRRPGLVYTSAAVSSRFALSSSQRWGLSLQKASWRSLSRSQALGLAAQRFLHGGALGGRLGDFLGLYRKSEAGKGEKARTWRPDMVFLLGSKRGSLNRRAQYREARVSQVFHPGKGL